MKRIVRRFWRLKWWLKGLVVLVGAGLCLVSGYIGLMIYSSSLSNSPEYIHRWFSDKSSRDELITHQPATPCEDAPFLLPSAGLIGLLWNDPAGPYTIFRRHSGIDIFGDGEPGEVPVYAVYDGYLTRLSDWKSAVIIQHEDPLQPGRTIWTYYAHMASADGKSYIDPQFPPGTEGKFVKQGDLIGYQGEYNGNNVYGIGLHLHFSIVLSEDDGSFKSETNAQNTLDPSPYFGLPLNIDDKPQRPIQCEA